MDSTDLARWAKGLRHAAGGAPTHIDALTRFVRANRTNALPFLTHRGVVAPAQRPADPDPDAALWWAVVDRSPEAALRILPDATTTPGPIFPQDGVTAIEVWSESELSALHALWWLSRTPEASLLRDRMFLCARWHLENTQPDNATNRPWAIPVYLELAMIDRSPAARLFAETLLHNARAANGVPEPFSAQILLDAADAVDQMLIG